MEKILWRCLSGTNDFEPGRISTELVDVLAVHIENDRFAGSGLTSFERFIPKSTGIAGEASTATITVYFGRGSLFLVPIRWL